MADATKRNGNAKIYAPLLYIAGWYSSSQLNATKLSYTDQIDGNSSGAVAWFVVLITISAYLIWKVAGVLSEGEKVSGEEREKIGL